MNRINTKHLPIDIYAIILAAGNASRFTGIKQLAVWGGSSLIRHALELAHSVFDNRVIVVLGANKDKIRRVLAPTSAKIAVNPDWQKGVSTSIRTGIEVLPSSALAAMIMLADQPLIETDDLRRIIDLWQEKSSSTVASRYQNTVGAPALFPSSMFARLSKLSGDQGAKQVLTSLGDQLLTVDLAVASVDIDTQEDFEYLSTQKNLRRKSHG